METLSTWAFWQTQLSDHSERNPEESSTKLTDESTSADRGMRRLAGTLPESSRKLVRQAAIMRTYKPLASALDAM